VETETFERALSLEEQRERELPPQMRYTRPTLISRGPLLPDTCRTSSTVSRGSRCWCCDMKTLCPDPSK
jgi:hypothetical protein